MSVRTKIVATLGPASDSPERIRELIRAGVDVFRINFSHGSAAGRTRQLAAIRQVEAELQTPMAVLADLCGPKIRVRPVAGVPISDNVVGLLLLRAYQYELIADAAVKESRRLALQALAADPLVLSLNEARSLLDGFCTAHRLTLC